LLGADTVPVEKFIDEHMERTELLGKLVLACPLFAEFNAALAAKNGLPITLDDLVSKLWGRDFLGRKEDGRIVAGRFIQLVQAARSSGEGLLPLRAHVFVREHRNAYLCEI